VTDERDQRPARSGEDLAERTGAASRQHELEDPLRASQVGLIHCGVLMVIAVIIDQIAPPMAIALVISGRIADVDQLRGVPRQSAVFSGACWRFCC
jgi:hypothetical protein